VVQSTSIGVLGGLGPAATVDFMQKLVALTPATCDQEHLPVIIANLPHVHDRSRSILGLGDDPWPQLRKGIELLNSVGVGLLVAPCNSAQHWFYRMCEHSRAPMLHIGQASVQAIAQGSTVKVAIFATRGVNLSGFYRRECEARRFDVWVPDAQGDQVHVDACIKLVKAGRLEEAGAALADALAGAKAAGADTVILGCTELPIASEYMAEKSSLTLIDSSLELARAAVAYGLQRGWHKPDWAAAQ
jgi:aspartate racemase